MDRLISISIYIYFYIYKGQIYIDTDAGALAWRRGPVSCVRVYARVLVPPNLYLHTCMHL